MQPTPTYIELSLPLTIHASNWRANDREDALMRLGHKGTHLDKVLGSTVPLDYFKNRALVVDVSMFSSSRAVELTDVPLAQIQANDFVLFHSGAMQRHGYGSRTYLDEFFELSWPVIDALIERKVRFIGIDARGIRQNAEHREADTRCEQGGVYVIENLTGTENLPVLSPFTIYVMCFDMGGSGVPCRVIVEF